MSQQGHREALNHWLYERNTSWLYGETNTEVRSSCESFPQRQLAERTFQMHRERGAFPLKRESRVLRSSESHCADGIYTSLLLATRSTYCIQDQLIEEAREEGVVLQFVLTSQGWKIGSLRTELPVFLSTGYDVATLPSTPTDMFTHAAGYDRQKAVQYAETYWNSYNPAYRNFGENDCTNYISQVLHAGGIPMTGSAKQGWWYRGPNDQWSYSWTVAHSLHSYLGAKHKKGPGAEKMSQASELQIGDVICYDWTGDGRWDHNTIVTMIDPNGQPLVNAHSVDSQHRYWEYKDSEAWTPQTKYAFFHILN